MIREYLVTLPTSFPSANLIRILAPPAFAEGDSASRVFETPETQPRTQVVLVQIWTGFNHRQVFQSDAGKIKPGDPAEVTVDAYPARVFNSRVDYILPQLDMKTRTPPVRLVFANPGLNLRPGMYVNVRAKLPMGRQLVVPASLLFRNQELASAPLPL